MTSWAWDFGDGDSDVGQTVDHTYLDPGCYGPEMTITTGEGSFVNASANLIMVHSDTIMASDALGTAGSVVRVDLAVHNFVPLEALRIPFCWAGDLNLKLDSISTEGLRTDGIEHQQFSHYWSFGKKATYVFEPVADDPPTSLEAG